MNGVELVASWFTPAVFFCVLNLTIGAIFVRSKTIQQKPQSGDDHAPPQLGRVPSIFERVKSFKLSTRQPDLPDPAHYASPAQQNHHQVAHHQDSDEDREEPHHHVTRTRSQPVASPATAKPPPAKRVLKKSVSEKIVFSGEREEAAQVDQRRPATVREKTAAETGEDDAAVDGKADDFINMFRQQLKLQRMDSILRYKEMLTRGAGR